MRVSSTAFERANLGLRALNYVSYIGSSLLAGLTGPRPDLVLCMTDPPMVGDVGLAVAKRFGVPLLVISEDVFPEIATQLGRLNNRVLVGDAAPDDRPLPEARRPRRRDRRHDAPAARGEGRAGRSHPRDPELGGHGGDLAATARQRVGAAQQI